MSSTDAPSLDEAVEGDEGDQQVKIEDLTPERHDSKLEGEQDAAVLSRGDVEAEAEEPISRTNDAVAQNAAALPSHGQSVLAYRSPNHPPSTGSGLHVQTDVAAPSLITEARLKETPTIYETPVSTDTGSLHALSSPGLPMMSSSLRSTLSTSSMASSVSQGSGSALPSPYLAAMSDLTPLPSPVLIGESFGTSPWRRSLGRSGTPSRSRAESADDSIFPGTQILRVSSSRKRKNYGSLLQGAVETSMAHAAAGDNVPAEDGTYMNESGHSRNRSISDFVPEQLQNVRQRHVTFGPGDSAILEAHEYHMHREAHLASKRGLAIPVDHRQQPLFLTSPASTSSIGESYEEDDDQQPHLEDGTTTETLEIHCGINNKRRKFRQLRQLGEGTFSKVMLATCERIPSHPTPEIERHLNPHNMVAVKIVELGPAGGADEERIETGLKREVEMLKSLSHPSLIHLKACEYQPSRTLMVLTYCPGGDLFELASQKRDLLTPSMVQRIFSELVSAVRYLHKNWIVHRDIKLENVLVNFPHDTLKSLQSLLTHSMPIVTLTDLGLGRRIPEPPASPLLQTRCGSEDYAAPEILLGQPYDGRQTDAWALGVLLYAVMEGRLPFDAPPGKPDRSRNSHRIARCDWIWYRFGDDDGEWDPNRGAEFEGARLCVEGLLKKVRMGRKSLEEIEAMEWVQNGIQVPGGLIMREQDEDDAILL